MKKLLLLLGSTILLAGCWDVNEPERLLYIFGLGVDYKDGEYIMYPQIIDFSNIAKSEQPTNPETIQAEVGEVKGSTPSEAFYNLYQAIDEQLFWGHFSFIVFSEDALKGGRANMLINTFIRFHETRYNTWVYSTKENVRDILLITPLLNKGMSLSKLADPLNSYEQDSFIEPINFRRLIINLNEPAYEAQIPLVSEFKNWKTTGKEDTSAKIRGVAIISSDGLKGFVEEKEAAGLQWVSEMTKRSGITAETSSGEKMSILLDEVKPKIDYVKNGSEHQFDISVSVTATLSSYKGNVSTREVKDAVTKQVEEEIRKTYEKGLEMEADVYRFSEVLYRKKVKEWKKVEKDGKIPLTESSLRNIHVYVDKVTAGRKTYTETVE